MAEDQANQTDLPDDDVESASAFVRPRRLADDEIDMTPMIDCVFLLIIFFILTFSPDQSKSVPLPAAKYGTPVMGLESLFITASAGEGDTMKIYLSDGVDPKALVAATNVLDQEQAIIEYVKKGVAGNDGKRQVIIKGDGELTAAQINQIAKAAGQAMEGQSLHLAVSAEGR